MPAVADRSERVAIAWVHGLEVSYSWHASLMALVAYDVAHSGRVLEAGWYATKYGTGGIVQARNDTVGRFVADGSADWLMWVDTDMGFAPDSVDRLFAAADPVERPVVGGLCFMSREVGPDGAGGHLVQPLPTIFDWVTTDEGATGFQARHEYPRGELVRCAATGSAFVLVHRSAFERVADEFGPAWYSPVFNESMQATISEDLSFCTRLGALDIPVHVDTGVKTTHLKHVWLDERLFDRTEMLGTHTYAPGS